MPTSKKCPRCDGTGRYKKWPCALCKQTGRIDEERVIELRDKYWPTKTKKENWTDEAKRHKTAEMNHLLAWVRTEGDAPYVEPDGEVPW